MCGNVIVAAAQYLRMSTEDQQYSLANQEFAIRQYAEKKGFTITQTYTDAARSGVVLRRRSGLRQLLQDVIRGHPTFKVILVYDVSRWGRFQDSDEAAHYEFMCKSAGVPIH
jgi:DNA invertase Pin-like site-specific DNA recombinase